MSARAWLEERQALAAAATDGPWEAHTWKGVTKNLLGEKRDASGAELSVVPSDGVYGVMSPEDAEFMVDARSSVPVMAAALTAVLDEHEAEEYYDQREGRTGTYWCPRCRLRSPCPTRQAVEAALGGGLG